MLAFGLLFAQTEDALIMSTQGLVNGSFTPNQWGAQNMAILTNAHSQAYVMGAQSVGVGLVPADTTAYINLVMQEQAVFMQGFVDDLEQADPRYLQEPKTIEQLYPDIGTHEDILKRVQPPESPAHEIDFDDEKWDDKAIVQRLTLYNERVRGTANLGAVDMLDVTDEIKWIDHKSPEECQDCVGRGGKIYLKGTLPGVPGDGSTECGVRCRCHLELLDGTVIAF